MLTDALDTTPSPATTPDADAVRAMFGRIAGRYDVANRVLSLGIDLSWRRHLVRGVARDQPSRVLDLATGSGDVAFALARVLPEGGHITAGDFCAPMLDVARDRLSRLRTRKHTPPLIDFVDADALALPFADGSFDAATIAFGVRNFADRARGLSELRRVLRAGGRLHVLEFSHPSRWLRPLYRLHLHAVCPWVAAALTGDRDAYRYLGASIEGFPDRDAFARELSAAGFSSVHATPLTGGIVAVHIATH